jgi:hypothetical protein
MSGWTDLQAADTNIVAAVNLAVEYIKAVPAAIEVAVTAARAGDDAAAATHAANINGAGTALLTALPTPADPGTTPVQLEAAKRAVAKMKGA